MSEVADRVRRIIAERAFLDPATIRADATAEDLGIDSVTMVETIFAIEVAFDLSIPFNANTPEGAGFDVTSVGAIIASVEALVAARV
ncbi:MAG: acyl carrier protein [Rhodobacteraceae bacterium]|nr:acyl carrier protein [Paracoccaceae bacterium]